MDMVLHTTGTAARKLNISFSLLKHWIKTGKLPAIKLSNGQWVLRDEDLTAINRKENRG